MQATISISTSIGDSYYKAAPSGATFSPCYSNWEVQIGGVLKVGYYDFNLYCTRYSFPKYTSREIKSKCSTIKR